MLKAALRNRELDNVQVIGVGEIPFETAPTALCGNRLNSSYLGKLNVAALADLEIGAGRLGRDGVPGGMEDGSNGSA